MKFFKHLIIVSVGFVFVFTAHIVSAANTTGMTTTGTTSFVEINMAPQNGGITVDGNSVEGYAWGNTIGWVNFGPLQNAGVTNVCHSDKSMTLGGYAWGQNTGWINFAPTNGGVSIDANGNFSGYAWSQNHGWINFSGVATTFRCSTSESNNPGGGGGGGNIDVCTNITGVQSQVPTGYTKDPNDTKIPGICTLIVEQIQDSCPNIDGIQNVVPTGYYIDTKGDCQIDYCPNLPGNQTSTALCPGQVVDLCPNISGNQGIVPTGYMVNNLGQCVLAPIVDLCPNMTGNQASIPSGYIKDISGNCVQPSSSISDVCSNITGNQESIPFGYVFDASGDCIPEPVFPSEPETPIVDTPQVDTCPNLIGVQNSVPVGYTLDKNGNCISENPNDLCPNMIGVQPNVPKGYMVDESGNCIAYFAPIDTENKKGEFRVLSDFIEKVFGTNKLATPVVTGLTVVGLASTIPGFLTRIGNLVVSIPFRKKRRPWGIVYDSETKESLDPAHVVIYNAETNEVVDTKITDIHGRYGFLLNPGTYRIDVKKTNYEFPSKKLSQSHSDGVYENLYFGEVFTISNNSKDSIVVFNVPMDRIADDWNQQEKKRMGIGNWFTRNTKLWGTVSTIIFIIGFLFSTYALFVAPNIWNKLIFVLYIIFALLQIFGLKGVTTGTITNYLGKGVPFAVVRVWNSNLKTQVAQRITNEQGQYYILVAKGNYYITVDIKNNAGGYDRVLTSKSMQVNNGIINQSFRI